MKQTRLLICGDIMPTDLNERLMVDGDIDAVFGDAVDAFKAADYRFCNLEGTLTDRGTAINKGGPNLRATPKTADMLVTLGIDLVGLANNHSLDFGKEGLIDTMNTLRLRGIPFTGAGMDGQAARRIYRTEVDGYPLSFITVAEHEYTLAEYAVPGVSSGRAGANPFDPYDTIEDIEAEKSDGRIVIVIYHGGKEHYRLTSPNTRKRCRKMAEHGADFVFCQHTHAVCCYENHAGCHICYGQGNTMFVKYPNETWLTGVIPMINLVPSGLHYVEYIPIVNNADGNGIRLANEEEAKGIIEPFEERSKQVLDDDIVALSWREFYLKDALSFMRGFGFIDADGNLIGDKRRLNTLSNMLNCEIHHESTSAAVVELRRQQLGDLLVKGQEYTEDYVGTLGSEVPKA